MDKDNGSDTQLRRNTRQSEWRDDVEIGCSCQVVLLSLQVEPLAGTKYIKPKPEQGRHTQKVLRFWPRTRTAGMVENAWQSKDFETRYVVVCAFQFDEEAANIDELTPAIAYAIAQAQMNADNDDLRKTAAVTKVLVGWSARC